MVANFSNLALRIVSAAVLGLIVIATVTRHEAFFEILILLATIVTASEWIGIVRKAETTPGRFAWLIAGIPCIGAGSVALIQIHRVHDWRGLLSLFAIVWATDTFAYAAGRSIGGRKLAPRISPNKTWAGAWGGLAGGAVTGLVCAAFLVHQSLAVGVVLGGALSLCTQAGDLMESAFKRRFEVKDSGWIIPGHGGILDRIDGLLLAAPVFAIFHFITGGW